MQVMRDQNAAFAGLTFRLAILVAFAGAVVVSKLPLDAKVSSAMCAGIAAAVALRLRARRPAAARAAVTITFFAMMQFWLLTTPVRPIVRLSAIGALAVGQATAILVARYGWAASSRIAHRAARAGLIWTPPLYGWLLMVGAWVRAMRVD